MRFVIAILAITLSVACSGREDRDAPPDPVTGRITLVDLTGREQSFTVVTEDDERIDIFIDPERDYGFELSHLHVHHGTDDPVVVELELRGEDLYATSIEDA